MAKKEKKELKEVIETTNEIIVVELNKELVEKFDNAYITAGNSMADMCKLAYQICEEDKEARKLFTKHIVNDLGMSKATASQLVNTGAIYIKYPDSQALSHTKCAELLPVKDKVDDFLDAIEMDFSELATLSQTTIRDKVKKFVNPELEKNDTKEEATGDNSEEATEATGETSESAVNTEALIKSVKYLFNLVKLAGDTLKTLDNEYDLEEVDSKKIQGLVKELEKASIKHLDI